MRKMGIIPPDAKQDYAVAHLWYAITLRLDDEIVWLQFPMLGTDDERPNFVLQIVPR